MQRANIELAVRSRRQSNLFSALVEILLSHTCITHGRQQIPCCSHDRSSRGESQAIALNDTMLCESLCKRRGNVCKHLQQCVDRLEPKLLRTGAKDTSQLHSVRVFKNRITGPQILGMFLTPTPLVVVVVSRSTQGTTSVICCAFCRQSRLQSQGPPDVWVKPEVLG